MTAYEKNQIKTAIELASGLSWEYITDTGRKTDAVFARYAVALYLKKKGHTNTYIRDFLKRNDHTTIIHACREAANLLETFDNKFCNLYTRFNDKMIEYEFEGKPHILADNAIKLMAELEKTLASLRIYIEQKQQVNEEALNITQ